MLTTKILLPSNIGLHEMTLINAQTKTQCYFVELLRKIFLFLNNLRSSNKIEAGHFLQNESLFTVRKQPKTEWRQLSRPRDICTEQSVAERNVSAFDGAPTKANVELQTEVITAGAASPQVCQT